MSVHVNRATDGQDLAYLIRRNAYLEDVSDHQRGRIDELEKRIEQLEQGLAETSRCCTALGDDVQALLHGYRCARPEPVAPEAAPKEREG